MNYLQEQVVNHLPQGIVVIKTDETITFVNHRAIEILELTNQQLINQPLTKVIETAKLPFVLRTRKKQINQTVRLHNGKTIISSRIPLIDESNNLKGAMAFFYEVTDVVRLAEQVTNLKEIEKTLKTIVDASEVATTIVDEHGRGVLINSAYTKLTGLSKKTVIGKPVDKELQIEYDIQQKVLQSRRSIHGVQMKIGQSNTQIVANGSPILVDGKLKGSVALLHDVSKVDEVETELSKAKELIRHLELTYSFEDIIGNSSAMQLTKEQAKVAAITSTPVLIRGEPGTEKELVAHAIHHESERKYQKMIGVDCTVMSEDEWEKQLFGYQGVGALRHQPGYFEQANNGTLLLNEIDKIPILLQLKLLRVIQNNQIQPVNSNATLPINVRLIMTTSINLEKAMIDKSFDKDFYYVLNQMSLSLPPLRERITDLEPLMQVMLRRLNRHFGKHIYAVASEALEVLKSYSWPKNIRELEHVLRTAMVYMDPHRKVIQKRDLPLEVCKSVELVDEQPFNYNQSQTLQQTMELYEKQVIQSTFASLDYNKTKTAELLGISIRNLYYKMQKYKIEAK
ncbi:sigma 54-interacting transcriptional regulator [Aquibacillus sediminis]|uniref:sigma 54-interacting transcriptional regulator n=1 Tax=Aquibacillus sediminis TaxID=2574734 RepID=UPI0014863E36|nr:sigma 54-interacting transcriptional regulator [Aquibacillus sediminis]